MKELYVLFGLSETSGKRLQRKLEMQAQHAGYVLHGATRYRKEGIKQFIREHPEYTILVLQESMQDNYPYSAEELSELMDDAHLNIVVSLSKTHKGSFYMKELYAAGILNALYEEDATVDNIFRLLLYVRTRGESRRYYEIKSNSDAAKALNIIDEDKIHRYIMYIEDSASEEEVINKFRYLNSISKRCEMVYLVEQLPEYIQRILELDDLFRSLSEKREKRKWWSFLK